MSDRTDGFPDSMAAWDAILRADEAEWTEPDEPSLSLIAKFHDEGRTCGECGAQFSEANGVPSSCQFCKRKGSTLPLSKHPEVNTEAFKERARKRRKEKSHDVDQA